MNNRYRTITASLGTMLLVLLAGGLWAAQATTGETSKLSEELGITTCVTVGKPKFVTGEALQFAVTFKNTSDTPFEFVDVQTYRKWTIDFEDPVRKGPWRLEIDARHQPTKPVPRKTSLRPGETMVVTVDLSKDTYRFQWAGIQLQKPAPVAALRPGTYLLTLKIPADSRQAGGDYFHTQPVPVVIVQATK